MTDDPSNLTLHWMRRLDEKFDRQEERLSEVVLRLNELAGSVLKLRRDQVGDAESVAHVQARLDRMQDELDRIKRRLDISEPPRG